MNSTTTNVQTITYDNASRITALSETGTAGSKTYAYDNYDRLTSFFNATATTSYTYDANSNRLSMTLSGTTTLGYTTTSNRVQSLTGTTTASYGYDAMGNTTSDGTNTWTYDARGRMTNLTAGTTTAAYGINGFGQRITKSGSSVPSGGTNEFVYDEQGNFLGEYGSTGTIIEETEYLPNTPVPVMSKGFGIAGFGTAVPIAVNTGTNGATTSSVTPDWLGTPHIIANSTRVYQWTWDHYAFGDNNPNQNPAGLGVFTYNPRFPGQYKDAESGLNYNYYRDYNSAIGRYVQSDPIGLAGEQVSLYPYVASNPITRIDPTGLFWDPNEPCTGTEGADCDTGGGGFTPPTDELGPKTGFPQGESPTYGNQPLGSGKVTQAPSQNPNPSNDNICPVSPINPQNQCPLQRQLPKSMSPIGYVWCIYECPSGLRIKQFADVPGCFLFINPYDGMPYSPASPVR